MGGFLLALLCPVRGKEIDVSWGWGCTDCKKTLKADVGDVVKFDQGFGHNVYTMVDAKAYADCDFAGGTDLGEHVPVDVEIVAGDAGKTLYFGCQFPFHCASGSMVIAVEVSQVEKKQCDFAKTKAQNKRKYERGNEKKTKTCKWLIRKIEQIGKNYGPTKQGWFIKKTCKKSNDSEEKVAAKVCSCACKFYKKKGE